VSSKPCADSLMCKNRWCERKQRDPNNLSPMGYYMYVQDRGACNKMCLFDDCRVMIERVLCGEVNALQKACGKDSDDTD